MLLFLMDENNNNEEQKIPPLLGTLSLVSWVFATVLFL